MNTQAPSTPRNGARWLTQALEAEGVDTLFGYPGGTIMPFYDALVDSSLKHILVRHEQGAALAANGYARASGRVGVCVATSGPGASNLVTGIADAMLDSVPMVCITGQVPTPLLGTDAFQELDVFGMTLPIVKHSWLVRSVDELPAVVAAAFRIAREGRPGPVLIDMPKNVQLADASHLPAHVPASVPPVPAPCPQQLEQAIAAIASAEKPVVYAGGGVGLGKAVDAFRQFVANSNIPTVLSLRGLGALTANDPNYLGMLGMHGTYYANMAVTNSDLLISVGARFDDRVTGKIATFAPHAKIIHIDIDPTSIKKNVRVDLPIVGDLKDVLKKLVSKLAERKEEIPALVEATEGWRQEINGWKTQHPMSYKASKPIIKPQFVIEKLRELTQDDAIITTEVGQHQMWTAQFFDFSQPRTFLSSGGLGTMGYGLPSALGAQAAFRERQVIDISGDGSFQMNSQELATLVQYRLPVKIVILNNNFLGMVRQWQHLFFHNRYSQTCMELPIDFVKLAEAYGATGLQATKPDEVEDVIRKALDTPGPVIMEFKISREENVMPMVPAGAGLNEMVLAS